MRVRLPGNPPGWFRQGGGDRGLRPGSVRGNRAVRIGSRVVSGRSKVARVGALLGGKRDDVPGGV